MGPTMPQFTRQFSPTIQQKRCSDDGSRQGALRWTWIFIVSIPFSTTCADGV